MQEQKCLLSTSPSQMPPWRCTAFSAATGILGVQVSAPAVYGAPPAPSALVLLHITLSFTLNSYIPTCPLRGFWLSGFLNKDFYSLHIFNIYIYIYTYIIDFPDYSATLEPATQSHQIFNY